MFNMVKSVRSVPKLAAKLLLCLVMVVGVVAITGCRDTDALKEIIYDQNSDLIDYDNLNKYYINDSEAEEESDKVSSLEVSDEEPESDIVQNLIVYSSTPNTEGFTTKKSLFNPFPDFTGIEASESVFFYLSDSVDAFNHAVTPQPDEPEPEQPDEEEQTQEENTQTVPTEDQATTPTNDGTGAGTDAGGANPSPTPDTNGGGAGEPENPVEEPSTSGGFTSSEGVGDFKNPTIAFNIGDRDADVPQIDCVAAFGDYATLVQMIGGQGALAASDAATISAMQSAGVACTAVAAWTDASGDPASMDVEAIVNSGARAILVSDPGAYTTQLSTEKYNYLEANGIQWVTLRTMITSTNIKANVEVVGEMLQGSAVAAYGATANSRASEYISRHNAAISQANNGLAADTVNGNRVLQYQGDADGLAYSSNAATYTVLIDYWDPIATCNPGFSFDSGAAYASAGCATTPVSYYIQAGGSINNAAALSTEVSAGEIPVLQFSKTESWGATMWTTTSLPNILYSTTITSLLDSGVDRAATTQLGQGLGSDAMPKIIVTSTEIKNALVASSVSATSLYHPYSYVGDDLVYGSIGVEPGLWSCIGSYATSGNVGDPNAVYAGGIDADDVVVNPSGLFCDWTQGTVESFLEAGWVAAYINGTYDQAQWQSDVQDFYSWAWGVTVNMSSITNR